MCFLGIPIWILKCVGLISGVLLVVNLIYTIVHKSVNINVLKKHHELAGYVIGVFGILYSVFLGFTIVNSQQNLKNIIIQMDEEAFFSDSIFVAANAFPENVRKNIQKRVMEYLESIINEEWSFMSQKKEHPITLLKLEEIWKDFYVFKPQTEQEKFWYAKAIGFLLKQNNARLKRIYSTWETLGFLPWAALIIGGIILIILLFFFGTENNKAQRLLISLFSGYFVFMIYIVYVLDHPFNEPINIQPKAYKIIHNYNVKTNHTLISPEDVSSSSNLLP